MRKSIKAVLLSALVFPGTGHFSLKKPVQGTALLTITLFCLYLIISAVLDISMGLSEKIESGEISNDIFVITEMATEQLSNTDSQTISLAMLGILFCWLFGIFDSFRIGRLQDKAV